MIRKTSTRLSLVIGAFALGAGIGLITLKQGNTVAAIEPAAGAENEKTVPVPAHPVLNKDKSDKAVTIVADPPEANGVDGAPRVLKTDLGLTVSPLCFEQLIGGEGPKGPVDVTTCEQVSGYKNIKTGVEEGRYRSLYEFPAEPDMPAEKGFSSYELLGNVPSGLAVQTYNESGGTGRFSSLVLVKLDGNMLSYVDTIAGGDRCNGGLTDARVENGKLIYSMNATPGDLPVLAWGNDKGLKAYEDLEASAMSCYATVTYTDGTLSNVSFNSDILQQQADSFGDYTYQKCFNAQFKKQIDSGKKDLTAAEFRKFMDDFLKACKKP